MTAKRKLTPGKSLPPKDKPRRKPGRPSAYDPIYADMARKFCLLGATDEILATRFGVAVSAIQRWITKFPEFQEAIKVGRFQADAKVANTVYLRAVGEYEHPVTKTLEDGSQVTTYERPMPDTGAGIFWLKARQKWRDNSPVVQVNNETTTNTLRIEMTPEARAHLAHVRRILFPEKPATDAVLIEQDAEAKPNGAANGHDPDEKA